MKRLLLALLGVVLVLFVAIPAAVVGYQVWHEPGSGMLSAPVADSAEQLRRGAYLARVGDCMACHTARGGPEYAGGRAIPTPFGNIYTSNLTPHAETGIGQWTADDFWRALHNGKSKDGQFLYPAFPYTNYTRMTRADTDAIFAYLRTLEPVAQPNRPAELRFPYNQRILLAGWRALYFRPGEFKPDDGKSVEWNRGAYLVQGAGHCSACHTSRTTLGGSEEKLDLAGGLIPVQNWYAPALTGDAASGLGNWEARHIADLLTTGVSMRGTASGPMAEVVGQSLQYLDAADAGAIAAYLKSLPQSGAPPSLRSVAASDNAEQVLKEGQRIYEKYCVDCHKANGQGQPPAYPPLAGNRALTLDNALNPIRMVLNGGYPPTTRGNPRPYGMPPFAHELNDGEVAAVVSYMRNTWGNQAPMVSPVDVGRARGVPLN
ncbi:cytochrome c [Noviherbaspirillum sedimenti]|uniref:Cytochrome c n=1 Tax=Noviherbaspirillum sedimenti TaxID=2320865 RepID=A0A3A3G3I6_9BURK|nr:cytochrome c [Noviherbaspirillum sedimenti]RJG01052.1 cytochrome c [Noviherbaspirillum sedimenti]